MENKPVRGYRVFYSPTKDPSQLLNKTVDANHTAIVICELLMATNYTFRILGFNELDGPLSDPTIVKTTIGKLYFLENLVAKMLIG